MQVSPQFVEIYNQAKAAESFQLDQITGLGLRKALEFLIKDLEVLIRLTVNWIENELLTSKYTAEMSQPQ